MIGNGTVLQVADNSGAKTAACINQTGRVFTIGDLITVAVKTSGKGRVSAGSVRLVPG